MTRLPDISDYMAQQLFVALDTETTGLWALSHRVVEVAAVKFSLGGKTVNEFQSLVNPESKIPDEVVPIHGITDEMVADAPKAPEVLRRLVDFCGSDSILVAHNAPFDLGFIGAEIERAGLPYTDSPLLDTVDICRRYFPGEVSYSLLALVRRFHLGATQAHRALADALYVRDLVVKAATKQLGRITSREELLSKHACYHLREWKESPVQLPDGMSALQKAIDERLRLSIEYVGKGQPPNRRIVRPLGTYSIGRSLYVRAYCELAKAERTFRVDRITQMQIVDEER